MEQARNAGSLGRGNIKIIKQIMKTMKTNMGLPEIDSVLYLWKKLVFLKFCYKEIGQNTNFVELRTHKK